MADGGVGGESAEAIRSAALETDGELAEGGGFTGEGLIRVDEAIEGGADGGFEEFFFGRELLLFEGEEGAVELGAAFFDEVLEEGDLGVLAAEGEDGDAGDIGVGGVAGEEGAEGVGIAAVRSAPGVVAEEFEAIDLREDAVAGLVTGFGKFDGPDIASAEVGGDDFLGEGGVG